MSASDRWSSLFHAARAGARVAEDLEAKLEAAVEAGRAAYPEVSLDPAAFVAHLAKHLPEDAAASLASLNSADLYLACACGRGDDAALRAFESRYMARLPIYLARMRASATLIDDVGQVIRGKLFVPSEGKAPRIDGYTGRAPLERWVRTVAVNSALTLMRGAKGAEADADAHERLDALATPPDAEVDYMRLRYRAEFEAALRDAFASLDARERNVLRLQFFHELNIDGIGAAYGVHRATAARWIASTREKLLEQTRRLLRERLKISASEFDSVVALMQSRLDISLHGLIGSKA